ncbi:MAG: hypothetical protein QOK07_2028 [Gemmatimonadaceae bacterium]|jgi:hypothetical protein|nr:hypothetical protein [Gemmatimonadaceae bacterium]
MRARSNVVAALFASLAFASVSVAQKPEVAKVVSRDGATKLELINRQIIFQFTEQGAREASAGVAPKPGKKNWNWMDDALQGAASGVANMRIVFPVEDVRDARYDGGTLTLYMTSRPIDAAVTDRRGLFKYEDVPEDQAKAFVQEFRRLKASA